MSRTIEIEIDETKYKIRRFTLGQLEEIAQMGMAIRQNRSDDPNAPPTTEQVAYGFRIFEMAMKRADPPVENPKDELSMSQEEFQVVIGQIMRFSGLKPAEDAPEGEAMPTAAAAT